MQKRMTGFWIAFHFSFSLFSAELLDQGDAAFRQRRSPSEAQKALSLYREYYKKSPDDSEGAWRLAMACQFVGHRLTHADDEKAKLFREGADAGQSSLDHAKGPCAPCHFWTAINRALYGETVGALRMLASLKSIREDLKVTATISPDYAGGGAYRILALIEQKLPALLGGSNSRARQYLEKSLEAAPEEPLNYLFLARLLQEDEPASALTLVRRGLLTPLPPPDRIESEEARDELLALKGQLSPLALR